MSDVLSEVPQGTVLGPILFLIYISHLSEVVEANMKVYVDDTKIKRGIENDEDVEILQRYLGNL